MQIIGYAIEMKAGLIESNNSKMKLKYQFPFVLDTI